MCGGVFIEFPLRGEMSSEIFLFYRGSWPCNRCVKIQAGLVILITFTGIYWNIF